MCYSAQIYSDFRKYQRLGGKLDIDAYVKLAGWTKEKGTWMKSVPKGTRAALLEVSEQPEFQDEHGALLFHAVSEAEVSAIADLDAEVVKQEQRIADAQAKLASARPTKAAEKDLGAATKKRDAALKKIEAEKRLSEPRETERIYPGHFAPVLIRDPVTGERMVVPMRYRCRLPGWTEAMERLKPGTYNARRDTLTTVWKKLFGYNHGIMIANHFYESVSLHRLQQRELVPGERDIPVEIRFTPDPPQEMYLACLWRYVEPEGDEPGFYTFAAITRNPPPEVMAAGHDRCVIPIREENIEAWLNPDSKNLGKSMAILDDPIDAYYQHELAKKNEEEEAA